MPLQGNSGLSLHAYWNGSPVGVSTSELNIQKGTIVIDFVTPALWQRTSANDNSTFNQLTVGASGALTPTSVITTGVLESTSPTGGAGYGPGAGGVVTQATNISTGVTLSKVCGAITTVSSTLAAAASAVFTVTNTTVLATDTIAACIGTYAGAGTPICAVKNVVAGAFDVVLYNVHATAALNAALIVQFGVIRTPNS